MLGQYGMIGLVVQLSQSLHIGRTIAHSQKDGPTCKNEKKKCSVIGTDLTNKISHAHRYLKKLELAAPLTIAMWGLDIYCR